MSCPFKDIFGKPGEGVHSYRILGMAAVDWITTLLGAMLIAWKTNTNFFIVFAGLVILGEFMHWYFCVDTAVMKMINSYSQAD